MIEAEQFVEAARARGFTWYAGVPCSFLTPFINYVIDDSQLVYVSAANEGDAVAAAAGAYIGGKSVVAIMQNSGLGNAVSPLTSLTHVFRIPVLLICTHRGASGVADEPQHELMGQITSDLFTTMRIPSETFPQDVNEIAPALERAQTYFAAESRPYALIMQKGTVAAHSLQNRALPVATRCAEIFGSFDTAYDSRDSRAHVLERIVALTQTGNWIVIASTGFTGRELYALADRPNHLYMVGSMGCASSLGLGLAMARTDLRVLVIDGDGAALMRMGNFSTVGTYAGSNFFHLVLDNEAHDSTGAQATVAANVEFAEIARACGYGQVARGDTVQAVVRFLAIENSPGPRFLHLKITTGTLENLPRPTTSPPEVLARLRLHCGNRA
ncbi:MAG: phosphonopyruvate decarboxylase [Gammaproteobacteria bacterium]|nr:phosphonopyruvate decarboxylase [Gammaproteobacteria bacterium]